MLKNMGKRQPQSFNIAILFRGILSEISIEAKEHDVRQEILSVFHNCKLFELSEFTVSDFELASSSCRDGIELTYKADCWNIYVRLTRPLPDRRSCLEPSGDSDFETSKASQDHNMCISTRTSFNF